jgi:hypothetical protein
VSHEATNWAIKAVNGLGLNATDKLVLWHLADRHNPDFGCFPKQETLAKDCEVARSTVNRSLDKLQERGLISRIQRFDAVTKQQKSTRYLLAFEKGFHPQGVVSRVSNSDTEDDPEDWAEPGEDPVEDDDTRVSVGHGTSGQHGTLTCNEPITSPSPPSGEVVELSAGEKLDQLIGKWVPEKLGDLHSVERAWNALSADEQDIAVRLVDRVRADLFGLHAELPRLAKYLRAKLFITFEDAPPLDGQHFRVTPDRIEWPTWLAALQKLHGKSIREKLSQQGYLLVKTRWPDQPAGSKPKRERSPEAADAD